MARFTINTVTSLGTIDVASRVGMEKNETDFGIPLAKTGISSGPYIVIPIIGPNTMFQPVYVNDVSLAVIEALKINENKSKTFNICGSKQYSFYQLIKILLSLLERKRILIKVSPKLMMLPGLFLQNLPNPPFTYDQMKLLLKDNISDGLYPELEDLKIKPVLLETKLKELIDFYI